VFFVPPLLIAAILAATRHPVAATVAVVIGLMLVAFFRDPDRTVAGGERSIVAPADGKIVRLMAGADGATELSIFLSPLNVHMNRSPIAGRVRGIEYRPGVFRPAFVGAASHDNEQVRFEIEGPLVSLAMREITGVLVRRIVLWKVDGDEVRRGERIGLMKFGSRVDLVLPKGVRLLVELGQRVRGAETVIGEVLE
jgi:phosphatidylserine decarboxylase